MTNVTRWCKHLQNTFVLVYFVRNTHTCTSQHYVKFVETLYEEHNYRTLNMYPVLNFSTIVNCSVSCLTDSSSEQQIIVTQITNSDSSQQTATVAWWRGKIIRNTKHSIDIVTGGSEWYRDMWTKVVPWQGRRPFSSGRNMLTSLEHSWTATSPSRTGRPPTVGKSTRRRSLKCLS